MCGMASRWISLALLIVSASTSRFFLVDFLACRTLDANPYAVESESQLVLRSSYISPSNRAPLVAIRDWILGELLKPPTRSERP